ncbi:MAG: MotA/TolQ/ExbB proton channel family protein [Chitinispirillaceae bacterium]|nr:MotA/TolQ/ExbB proton channel family protein [Chitinispirillaceae bacterium]
MIQNLAGWFNSGGPFMWAILGVLAAACAVVLERIIFYYLFCGGNGLQLVSRLVQAIGNDNIADAKKIITRGSSPLTKLLRRAVEMYSTGIPFAEIQEGIEEAAIQQVPRLSQRLNYLSLCANIATLLGLLGTISGLQLSFSALASVEAAKKATMLASGISQAMITTAFGLIVAVPCMVVYTFLANKQARLTRDLDEATVRFLNFLKKKRP